MRRSGRYAHARHILVGSKAEAQNILQEIVNAKKPFKMALAFKNAVIAGRQSYTSGRIDKILMGNPSSPSKGII